MGLKMFISSRESIILDLSLLNDKEITNFNLQVGELTIFKKMQILYLPPIPIPPPIYFPPKPPIPIIGITANTYFPYNNRAPNKNLTSRIPNILKPIFTKVGDKIQ